MIHPDIQLYFLVKADHKPNLSKTQINKGKGLRVNQNFERFSQKSHFWFLVVEVFVNNRNQTFMYRIDIEWFSTVSAKSKIAFSGN